MGGIIFGFEVVGCRKDLNNPPTAVGGIRSAGVAVRDSERRFENLPWVGSGAPVLPCGIRRRLGK